MTRIASEVRRWLLPLIVGIVGCNSWRVRIEHSYDGPERPLDELAYVVLDDNLGFKSEEWIRVTRIDGWEFARWRTTRVAALLPGRHSIDLIWKGKQVRIEEALQASNVYEWNGLNGDEELEVIARAIGDRPAATSPRNRNRRLWLNSHQRFHALYSLPSPQDLLARTSLIYRANQHTRDLRLDSFTPRELYGFMYPRARQINPIFRWFPQVRKRWEAERQVDDLIWLCRSVWDRSRDEQYRILDLGDPVRSTAFSVSAKVLPPRPRPLDPGFPYKVNDTYETDLYLAVHELDHPESLSLVYYGRKVVFRAADLKSIDVEGKLIGVLARKRKTLYTCYGIQTRIEVPGTTGLDPRELSKVAELGRPSVVLWDEY